MANTNDLRKDLTLPTGQVISGQDPNYEEYVRYANQAATAQPTQPSTTTANTVVNPVNQATTNPITPAVTGSTIEKNSPKAGQTTDYTSKEGISALMASGNMFNEADAKNYAFAKGDSNYKQYIGGIGGQVNPNYIGSTNWKNLQTQYTPYQLEKATTRTKDGIYWNPNVNIGQIPAADPAKQINSDTKKIAAIVTDAKKTADKMTSDAAKKAAEVPSMADTATENETTVMNLLKDQYGDSAEDVYNKLYNTPEMNAAKTDVNNLKKKLDEYDQQIDDLKDDIRKEVEGEASESYITALATVRGDKILKMKRSTQRDYDTALAQYNGLKDNANNLLQVRVKDSDTRYNRLFSMLQLQIQQEGTKFSQETAVAQLQLQIPEGRSMTIGGQTVTGLKENDDLNVVQFTEANGNTYVIGINKKTGKQAYKQFIGKAKVSGTGTGVVSPTTQLANLKATQEMNQIETINKGLANGTLGKAFDDKGKEVIYDKTSYDAAMTNYNAKKSDWNWFNDGEEPTIYDYQKY